LSLLPKLRARSDFTIAGAGNAVNYGANKLRFLSPVPAGAKLHARSRLINVEAKPKGTLVTQEIRSAWSARRRRRCSTRWSSSTTRPGSSPARLRAGLRLAALVDQSSDQIGRRTRGPR